MFHLAGYICVGHFSELRNIYREGNQFVVAGHSGVFDVEEERFCIEDHIYLYKPNDAKYIFKKEV